MGGRRASVRSLIFAGGFAAALAGCGHASVPMPADSAAPDVVLDTYLRAQVAADCTTVRALTLETAVPCDGSIKAYAFDHSRSFSLPDGSVQFHATLTVTIEFGMTAGEHGFYYYMGRQPNGVWRVTSGGDGP
jgi:hypothetical protein